MYHINSNGEPGPCKATKGNCPFGSVDEHFSSKDEARAFYEKNAGVQVPETIIKMDRLKHESNLDSILSKAPLPIKKDTLLKDMPRGLQIKALKSPLLHSDWIKEALFLNDTTLLSHIIENPNVSAEDINIILEVSHSQRIKAYAANHPKANKKKVLEFIRKVSERNENYTEYGIGAKVENDNTVIEILTQSPHFPKEMYFSKDIEPELDRWRFKGVLRSPHFNENDIRTVLDGIKEPKDNGGIYQEVLKNPNTTQELKRRIAKETENKSLLIMLYEDDKNKELSDIAYKRLINQNTDFYM